MTTAVVPRPESGTDDLSVWPASTTRLAHGGLAVGGVDLADVAARFGTPVYVLDEGEVRERCRTYRNAFPEAEVLYAAKAFLSRAMVRWAQEEGDVRPGDLAVHEGTARLLVRRETLDDMRRRDIGT
ncbi:hypothetical protein ADK59_33845 [Streptomyces sp. XY332]|nr:hypothetical protein ADK59_33845 [Streptomyces sp. XY332]